MVSVSCTHRSLPCTGCCGLNIPLFLFHPLSVPQFAQMRRHLACPLRQALVPLILSQGNDAAYWSAHLLKVEQKYTECYYKERKKGREKERKKREKRGRLREQMEHKPQLVGKYPSCCFTFGFGMKHCSAVVERMEAMHSSVTFNHDIKNECPDT